MKILLVHNFYGSSAPSGENTAYRAELALLRSKDHNVEEYTRTSDEIRAQGFWGRVRGAMATPWNPFERRAVKSVVDRIRPEVAHVHNVFPLLSPSIFYAFKEARVPVVLTLHNYRLACPAATAVRDDQPCLLCLEKRSVCPAMRFGCYRHSRMATVPVAAMIALHRMLKTWERCVDAFIVLTEFQRKIITAYGIPERRLFVKPHFTSTTPTPLPWEQREDKVVFVGRLYEAKGVHLLLKIWQAWGATAPRLEIIGDGPMMSRLQSMQKNLLLSEKVVFRGNLPHETALAAMATAKLLVLPSLCPEGFPMVVTEAFARGIPIAASRIGSLQTLIDDKRTGILFSPGAEKEMLQAISQLWKLSNTLRDYGAAARADAIEKYGPAENHDRLMAIYASVKNTGINVSAR